MVTMVLLILVNSICLIDVIYSKIVFQKYTFTYRRLFNRIIIMKSEIDTERSFTDEDLRRNIYLVYKLNGEKIRLKDVDGFSLKSKLNGHTLISDILLFFKEGLIFEEYSNDTST